VKIISRQLWVGTVFLVVLKYCGLLPAMVWPSWATSAEGGVPEPPSGRPDDLMELAMLLGITYKRDRRGDFIDANVLTVLNKAGEIVHRHEGLQ